VPCPAEDDFHALLAEQNLEMDTLGLQVRTLRYLPDNQTYVGLINTVRGGRPAAASLQHISMRTWHTQLLQHC
jgi:hypothetical protein